MICNLKAHKSYDEILKYREDLKNINSQNLELIIAPSDIYLPLFKDVNLSLCAQNLSLYADLNLTGDTSITALSSLNVKYIIIGHYERQKYYHESEQELIKKIKLALKNNFKVIYCIGETIEELNRKVEYQVIEKALARIFNNLDPLDFKNIIIAYEPTYLIGTDNPYNINKIKDTINFIKNLMLSYYHYTPDVVYGGNIKIANIKDFLTIKNLDGFIIGSSILNPQNIEKFIEFMTKEDN